jgi:hypothetical protein
MRYKMTGLENKDQAVKAHPKGGFIVPIWHEQAFGILTAYAGKYPFVVLASKSKDGDFAAYISEKFGFTAIRGSSRKGNVDKGGKEAKTQYVEKLKLGQAAGITVDGPKGPRHVCKPGIVSIAEQAECMILPIVASYSSYWEFKKAWDQFKLPKPFSKILVRHGEPILVPKGTVSEDFEKICREIEMRLKETQIEADKELKLWV